MNILIADDDFVSRTLLIRLLEKMQYSVVSCENGKQALQRMSEPDAPDLAILDWMMPEMDGPDVIRSLRRSTEKHPYLILLTNRNETSDKIEGLESGADDYLIKPVNPGELQARVRVGIRFIELQKRLDEKSQSIIRLERQQKVSSLAQMAGGVAHLLNNKLQAVIGFLDLILLENPHQNQPETEETLMLRRTRNAAEDAADIGKKMLTYLSQNQGERETVKINQVIQDVIDELLPEYPVLNELGPFFTQEPPENSFFTHANPEEMHEAILQVFKNALEANPLHPPHLRLERKASPACGEEACDAFGTSYCEIPPDGNPFIRLIVQDTGPGIPADIIHQIFDPFMTTKFTGRGMGLPLCLGILKKIGGGICVSCPKNGGTRVAICMPEKDIRTE